MPPLTSAAGATLHERRLLHLRLDLPAAHVDDHRGPLLDPPVKERQGDFVFTANEVGEYRFCFNNEMSTFAEKLVDFEIAV